MLVTHNNSVSNKLIKKGTKLKINYSDIDIHMKNYKKSLIIELFQVQLSRKFFISFNFFQNYLKLIFFYIFISFYGIYFQTNTVKL